MKSRNMKQVGFTLIEMVFVLLLIGFLIFLFAPSLKGSTTVAEANTIADFDNRAVNNWRLLVSNCGVSSDVSASTLVASPSAANSMGLIVSGTSHLASGMAGCYGNANVELLHSKAQGNATDGYKVGGYATTWSGGGGAAIGVTHVAVPVETAHVLYKRYSSASGASTSTALPSSADTTDPMIRFTAPAGGTTTVTLLYN